MNLGMIQGYGSLVTEVYQSLGVADLGFNVYMYKYSWEMSTERYYACRSLELRFQLEQIQSKDRQSSELFQPR